MSFNDKRTRSALALQEKNEIFIHKENNPNVSFENIGFIFSEKWGKKVSKMLMIR